MVDLERLAGEPHALPVPEREVRCLGCKVNAVPSDDWKCTSCGENCWLGYARGICRECGIGCFGWRTGNDWRANCEPCTNRRYPGRVARGAQIVAENERIKRNEDARRKPPESFADKASRAGFDGEIKFEEMPL